MRPQTLIGLSALLLSLCGLFIAIYEASLIRQAQRASVWPYVEVGVSIRLDGTDLWVQNTGVGPARIQAAAVIYEGQTQTNWRDLIRSAGEDPDSVGAYQSLISGRVLAADSPRERIFAVAEDNGAAAQELIAWLRREIIAGTVDFTVCYCSVYEECWISNMQDVVQRSRGVEVASGSRAVDSCAAAKRSGI